MKPTATNTIHAARHNGEAPLAAALNIVVVEDHDDLRATTVMALSGMGHSARGVACAEALDTELAACRADLLVIDLGLPGEDGLSLTRRMRAATPAIGIIILTGRMRQEDKLAAYASGADLYLTKPTSAGELGAAIQSLSRRMASQSQALTATAVRLVLNPATLQVLGPAAVVDISDLECTLLRAFINAAGQRLDTAQLTGNGGEVGGKPGKGALEVQLVRLRRKLEQADAAAPTIKALRGAGYQLCVALTLGQPNPLFFNAMPRLLP